MNHLREYQHCLFCGLRFMPVDFLAYRQKGYCTEGCKAHEKRTANSPEDLACKNGFTLRKARMLLPKRK